MASKQANLRLTMARLLEAARLAGWERVKVEGSPDGSVRIDAGMSDGDMQDDFLSCDLRMGK
jgi:hypothetical protein